MQLLGVSPNASVSLKGTGQAEIRVAHVFSTTRVAMECSRVVGNAGGLSAAAKS